MIQEPHPHILPRTRLYNLTPCKIGTIWRESLTGYINRLGWAHHVAPRALIAQEVVSQLSSERHVHTFAHVSVFGYQGAMVLNGHGVQAQTWISIFEQLTGRTDLSLLTLPWWIGNLSSRKQLRTVPAWCSFCLSEWQEQEIYQPLLWTLQIVTICPRHCVFLKDQCSQCQKHQAVIAANKSRPGVCTHCGSWLGEESQNQRMSIPNDDLISWQKWVVDVLEELHEASLSTGMLTWEPFFAHLATCLAEDEGYSKAAKLARIQRYQLYQWGNLEDEHTPTLETILKFCYVCDVTPLQIINNQVNRLRQAIQDEATMRVSLPGLRHRHVDLEQCQRFLQAVLDGHEKPQGLRQIEKHLGYTVRQLSYHFPKECALITPLAQEHRRQRKEERINKIREQVRQAVISIHSQGIYPSQRKLRLILPGGFMRMAEAKEVWRATLQELGFEL